jgi:hypothetical protein
MAAHGESARTAGGASEDGQDGEEREQRAPPGFEYRSRLRIGGLPLVHVVRGIDPSSGRRPPAVGLIAIGQVAVGLIAIGQVAVGIISIGQAAVGLGWGIGQLAFGLLAAGQVAAGVLGAVGQVAASPHAFGMVSSGGAWVVAGWLLAGLGLYAALSRRRRLLAPLLAPRAPRIADVRDGSARVAAEVVSLDCLKAPLSSRDCVFWHAVSVGPAGRAHERGGGEIRIGDGSGIARVDLGADVIFIRSDDYSEMVGPDWALHLETSLARGDQLHVAGPVALGPDTGSGGVHRNGAISPLFSGRRGAPVIVSTRDPAAIRAELRFAAGFAWALLAGAVLAATRFVLI